MRFTTLVIALCAIAVMVTPVNAAADTPRVIRDIAMTDTPEGAVFSFTEQPLQTLITRRSGNWFQLVVPSAGASLTRVAGQPLYSGKAAKLGVTASSGDAVFTFTLSPGYDLKVTRYVSRLELLLYPVTTRQEKPELGISKQPTQSVEATPARAYQFSQPELRGSAPAVQTVAQTNQPATQPQPQPRALTIRKTGQHPTLEDLTSGQTKGLGSEVRDFRQYMPNDGSPATRETRAYLSYSETALYIAFICKDDPAHIRAHISKREDIDTDDSVSVILDTFNDHRRAYQFSVNPLGVQADSIITEGQGEDASFDAVWYSEGRVTGEGYVVLVEIPFKSLRFSSGNVQTWGIALKRSFAASGEEDFYPYVTQRKEGLVQQATELQGIANVNAGHNIQVTPYYVASTSRSRNLLPNPPAKYDNQIDVRTGFDAKVVVKNAVTIDATVNPDFSQVESDEPQPTVNTRFETFYPEKRPFFIENAAYFQTPDNLFFSRRIVDPQFGVRLTGKLGKWAVGGLLADDRAQDFFAEPALFNRRSYAGVLRVQREFGDQSFIAGFVSDYKRPSGTNSVISADARVKINDNWSFTGQATRSYWRGRDGGNEQGHAIYADLDRSGRSFNYDLTYLERSPGYRADLGFIERTDIRGIEQRAEYRWHPNKHHILSFGPTAYVSRDWDFSGRLQDWFVSAGANVEFSGSTQAGFSRSGSYEFYRNRGYRYNRNNITFGTQSLGWLGVDASYYWGRGVNYFPTGTLDPFVANSTGGYFSVSLTPSTRFRVQQSYIYTHLGTRGNNVFYNHILRTKANYQFSRRFSVRMIVDYNALLPNTSLIEYDRQRIVTGDILVTYYISPGTAVYFGYTEGYDTDAGLTWFGPGRYPFSLQGRRFFVKFTNLFRF
jgi:hypothetical protein